MSRAFATIDFCGEIHRIDVGQSLTFGRAADLVIDDNQFLHRRVGQLAHRSGLWWLDNIGTRIPLSVKDLSSRSQVTLAPGRSLAISFPTAAVQFSAGRSNYELEIAVPLPVDRPQLHLVEDDIDSHERDVETTSLADVPLTLDQKLLIIALAEPTLRSGEAAVETPSNRAAAHRLGWTITRFNRKLDNVCDRLTRAGVSGMRGQAGVLASDRRTRLVEHAVSSGLVSPDDLALLP